jgi:hypothetical protein
MSAYGQLGGGYGALGQQQAFAANQQQAAAQAYAVQQQVQFYNSASTTSTTIQTMGTTSSTGFYITGGTFTNSAVTTVSGGGSGYQKIQVVDAPTRLVAGTTYDMPDGSKVVVDMDGSYRVEDKDAKVIYRAARVRDFNPFLNASDLLEEYIHDLVPQGIRQDEVLHLEIEHFIYWLICKAAERDNDPLPADIPQLPDLRAAVNRERFPRCRCCGRFIRRAWAAAAISFCSPIHMEKQLMRISI